ncbi:fimbria/pilus periplasmic chaperone [Enterobacter hormaechei]
MKLLLNTKHNISLVLCLFLFIPILAQAGGITLGGTRLVYPVGQKQGSMTIRNTDKESSFMIQTWIENAEGNKTEDFIVTPPVYVSAPGNENVLRVMYVGDPVRKDQETLYYFNTKSIPSIEKERLNGENILMLAVVTRIKLFMRPTGLKPDIDKAPLEIKFKRVGRKLKVENPTPYYITLAQMKIGNQTLPDTMIPPRETVSLPLTDTVGKYITYRTINDFGAATPELKFEIE